MNFFRNVLAIDAIVSTFLICGTKLTITSESNGWGKTADGWIKLSYTAKA